MEKTGASMLNRQKSKSISLVLLYMLSILLGLAALPTVQAVNETTQGTVTGVETWTGTMNLQGDVEVAEGAKLIINAGTTINIPPGKYIDVRGAICIGDTACGASAGSASSQARFIWSDPTDTTRYGRCTNDSLVQDLDNIDAACGSGMVIRNTIDQAQTSIKFAHFEGAYGYPLYIQTDSAGFKYGVLVFDGSSTTVQGLTFNDVNTSNVLLYNLASPTISDSSFVVGNDASFESPAIQAYGAGAGIFSSFRVLDSDFTGNDASCDDGVNVIDVVESYIDLSRLNIDQSSFGVILKKTSGSITDSTINVECSGINTNGFKSTGLIEHTLYVNDNVITTTDLAGLTAYDNAKVVAHRNVISGAASGSGVGIRSSQVELVDNTIGPVEGYNGLWIYGASDVTAIGNTIQDTGAEPVLMGEYHIDDQGWSGFGQYLLPARLYLDNNIISNVSGTCTANVYDGEFDCPAIHVFRTSATIVNNTISGNTGDIIRATGAIVNVQGNTGDSLGGFAGNISVHDDNQNTRVGSIAYFSGNTWTGVSQVYNITESRVTVQSEQIPSPGNGELYPVNLQWLSNECPYVQNACISVPPTSLMPPRGMPMALELVQNATVFSFADLANFDTSMIHVQNQNSAWGSQIQEGELVRYQVKAKNSNMAGATVVIRDATGLPLYELETDAFGFTQQVSLPSDFMLDHNWNHEVGERSVAVPGSNDGTGQPIVMDEDSCADGIDNDGDTLVDGDDADCLNGRELPFYTVDAYKFGSGKKNLTFVLSGEIDDVINLENLRPSVSVDQADGASFATNVVITGDSYDGINLPTTIDYVEYENQFGLIRRVEVQPPGSQDWYSAVDTSGANGMLTATNHPFKTWSFTWDLSAHPEGEGDVTFRIRSYDGLDYSPVQSRLYKLNLVPPTLLVDVPTSGSTHSTGSILFQGTAADPYVGVYPQDIKNIWFKITGPGYNATVPSPGSTSWSFNWDVSSLPSGEYTVDVWAADSDFCIESPGPEGEPGSCTIERRVLTIDNENTPPILQVSWVGAMDQSNGGINGATIRAAENTTISGVARDVGGQVTRVEIGIVALATGLELNDGPLPVTQFNPDGSWMTTWDTSDLIDQQVYQLTVRAYDGRDYSEATVWRLTIENPLDADNVGPIFDDTSWPGTITIFCDSESNSFDRCGQGAVIDLTQFFSDPDGSGVVVDDLEFYVFDSDSAGDDNYDQYIRLTADGEAIYNPVETIAQTTNNIPDWSLEGVMFYAVDTQESREYSLQVNFLVRAVAFTVERVDSGEIKSNDPAEFQGTGLPGSQVVIRFADGNSRLNDTRVLSDGTWSMQLTSGQLGDEGRSAVIFEMDGQIYQFAGQNEPGEFTVAVASGDGGGSGVLNIVLLVLGVLVLLGAGAYFFIEFEDVVDEDELTADDSQPEEDPYAWAKAKQTPELPAASQVAAPAAAAEPAAPASQHPGWLWDQGSNQWVADPDYTGEQ